MATKTKGNKTVGEQVKANLGRTQRWLAGAIKMSEPELSSKINGYIPWTQDDLDKINKALNTTIKL